MRLTILLTLMVLLSAVAYADQSFIVSHKTVDNKIFIDEVAEFEITITNFDVVNDRFNIYTTNPEWNVYADARTILLDAKESRTMKLILDPTTAVDPAAKYSIPISVKSNVDDEIDEFNVEVIVDSDRYREFQPSIFTTVSVGENGEITPNKPFDVSVRFINKNRLLIDPLVLQLQSPFFTDEITLRLDPSDSITTIHTYELDPTTQPQNIIVDVSLRANNKSLGTIQKVPVSIIEYTPGFDRNVITNEEAFLKKDYKVELFNKGNVVSTETIQLESSFLQKYFTKSNIPFTYEGNQIVFAVTLEPGTGVELQVSENYRPFALIAAIVLILIIVAISSYYAFRAPIIISKRVEVMQSGESVSKLKIVLDVKNRTGKHIETVKVLERIPNITQIDKNFVVGTLKPSKIITSAAKGTLVRWDFPQFDPYEERIITYTITSKLSILGEIKLPATIVKYDSFGQTRTVTEKTQE